VHIRDDHRWALVLAGGSGTRLASLTIDPAGRTIPKQYWSFTGQRTLLGDALARAEALVPRERIAVVVAEQHEELWRRELRDRDPRNVIRQPQNRGTAAGVLLPLLDILQRDADAQITLLPSDHFVADGATLCEALLAAQGIAAARPRKLVLLGIPPDAAEPDFGYIQPRPGSAAPHPVVAFHEKPGRARAEQLLRDGAVWNTFLIVASGAALLALYARHLPGLLRHLRAAPRRSPAALAAAYADLEPADFSRDLLERATASCVLEIVPECGWTDLGTPARVAACAARSRS
jgi:mannose-1-phosphate guanylyltransferase